VLVLGAQHVKLKNLRKTMDFGNQNERAGTSTGSGSFNFTGIGDLARMDGCMRGEEVCGDKAGGDRGYTSMDCMAVWMGLETCGKVEWAAEY